MAAAAMREPDKLTSVGIAARNQTIAEVTRDPWLGHKLFFSHRMPDGEADFHKAICDDFWFGPRWKQILGFRGCGKSTIAESNIALSACLRVFKNLLIIGSSETRAAERLAVVAYQLEMNEALSMIFGAQRVPGNTWTTTKLVLSSGHCIQALGRDQDIRGIKHQDWRPDCVVVDDFESEENVRTPEARRATLAWFVGQLLPACEPSARVIVNGTVLDEESVPMLLWKQDHWPTRMIPIEYLDPSGERAAAWPARFSLPWIDDRKRTYSRLGQLYTWNAEYMMQARSAETMVFAREQFRYLQDDDSRASRSYHACYAMIDPARTTNRNSATTGWAVWSWQAHRLIVWAAGAGQMLPDEILDLVFTIDAEFSPVWIGVEEDGLNQWLLQPLRHEQVKRGISVPLKALRAPRSKLDFIRGLQPFFEAREVIFAKPLHDLEEQLLSFPTGRIDAPNALAYALPLRPGALIHDNWTEAHVAHEVIPDARRPLYLAANATRTTTAAVLVQYVDGQLRVLADWVKEGEPAEVVASIAAEASLAADGDYRPAAKTRSWTEALKGPLARLQWTAQPIRWVTPIHHRDRYNNVGLNQAIGHIPATLVSGAVEAGGRQALREQLAKSVRGVPAVSVSRACHWTLRAFAGGYCRALLRGNRLADFAEEGPYRVLIEALESFAGIMARPMHDTDDDEDNRQPYAYDKNGRRYLSAMPAR